MDSKNTQLIKGVGKYIRDNLQNRKKSLVIVNFINIVHINFINIVHIDDTCTSYRCTGIITISFGQKITG